MNELSRHSTKEAIPRARDNVASSSLQLEPSGSGTDRVSHLCEGHRELRQSLGGSEDRTCIPRGAGNIPRVPELLLIQSRPKAALLRLVSTSTGKGYIPSRRLVLPMKLLVTAQVHF